MLTEKIGNLIMPKPKRPRICFDAKNSLEDETSNLPIIQRSAIPFIVNPDTYKDACSKPSALQAFSKLADIVPTFSRYYSISHISIEKTYSNLINGVTITPDSEYVQRIFSNAKQNFEDSKYSNIGGAPGYWHPVYADPEDWYEPSGFTDLNFNLTGEDENNGMYRIIPIPTKSELGIPNELLDGSNQEKPKKVELDPDTKLKSINFKFKKVDLYRDWLDFSIFGIESWAIRGLNKGYYSSGTIKKNTGIMPLVTNSILLAMDVEIDAEYAGDDEKVIKENKNLCYGPFALNNKIQIFGWISSLVPLSPSRTL